MRLQEDREPFRLFGYLGTVEICGKKIKEEKERSYVRRDKIKRSVRLDALSGHLRSIRCTRPHMARKKRRWNMVQKVQLKFNVVSCRDSTGLARCA